MPGRLWHQARISGTIELAQSAGYKGKKEDILEEITKDIGMMFLCNPNNPTGELTDQPLLLKILDKCRSCGVLLVLDECFLDFLPKAP